MYKLTFLVLILFHIIFFQKSDNQKAISGIVKYDFIRPSWEGNVWKPKSYNSELQFNSSESIFFYNKLSMLNEEKEEAVLTPKGFGFKALNADKDGYQFYRNFETKEIFIRIPKITPLEPVSVKDNWLEIDWQIENDIKTILGYSCQKAVGEFRGRVYEVWFTREIPLPYGPWKLFGLPGLILEARDTKNQIKFLATEVCYTCETNVEIENSLENKRMTIQEFAEYEDYIMENVENEFKSKLDSLKNTNKIDSSIEIKLDNPTTKKDIRHKRSYMPEIIYEWENKSMKKLKN